MPWLDDVLFYLPEAFQGYQLTLDQFLSAGGWVMQIIALLCLLLFSLLVERYWYRYRVYRQDRQAVVEALKQQLQVQPRLEPRLDKHPVLKSLLCDLQLSLNQRLSLIRSLISLCPLLGLLGTVSGMIQVFDVLAISGTGNPRLMAAGIASATLPTLAGMAVSVMGLLLYSSLKNWSDRQSEQLNSTIRHQFDAMDTPL